MRVFQARTKRPLNLLAVGAGGRVAAASSAFGVRGDVDVWDVASGQLVGSHPTQAVSSVAFTPVGPYLLVGEQHSIAILDPATGRVVANPPAVLGRPEFAFSADGKRLLLTEAVGENSGLGYCEFAADRSFRSLWSERPPRYRLFGNPAVSPDGSRVAVDQHEGFGDHPTNTVQVRDAATGKVLVKVEFGGSDPVEEIVFSADGAKVLARSSGRTVRVFDAATGRPAGELLHPGRPFVTGVAVHPDGTVACCRNSGAVCLWNLEKREIVRTLDWKVGKLVSVAFAPDGSVGAAGTEDGQVVVWDVD